MGNHFMNTRVGTPSLQPISWVLRLAAQGQIEHLTGG